MPASTTISRRNLFAGATALTGGFLLQAGSAKANMFSDFLDTVVSTFCAPDFYRDKNLLQTVVMTSSFINSSTLKLAEGAQSAASAAGLKRQFAKSVITDAAKLRGISGVATSFENATQFKEISGETTEIINNLKSRKADPAMQEHLRQAYAALYVSNSLSIQSLLGINRIVSTIKKVDTRQEFITFLARHGVSETAQAALMSPAGLKNLGMNAKNTVQLLGAVREAGNFDTENATLKEMKIDITLDQEVTAAELRTSQVLTQYPDDLPQSTNGNMLNAVLDDNKPEWMERFQKEYGSPVYKAWGSFQQQITDTVCS